MLFWRSNLACGNFGSFDSIVGEEATFLTMTKSWRPDDWRNKTPDPENMVDVTAYATFEAGADAILEAIVAPENIEAFLLYLNVIMRKREVSKTIRNIPIGTTITIPKIGRMYNERMYNEGNKGDG